jgi:thiamine pyrophosphokinase
MDLSMTPSLMRHISACRNVELPGRYRPLRLGSAEIGWVAPEAASLLLAHVARGEGSAVVLENAASLARACDLVMARGLCAARGEAFDVRETPGGPALAQLDRGAVPVFGVLAQGVHLNGLVQRGDGLHLWVARRARDKQLDPGKLDHVAAGGAPAGMPLAEVLAKEAEEEAGLPSTLIASARRVATLSYVMSRREGLRRDVAACYDLYLPESVQPRALDGEVESFELWPVEAVVDRVRRTDDFKFNVNLVLIDLFLRLGLVPDAEAAELRAALYQPGW